MLNRLKSGEEASLYLAFAIALIAFVELSLIYQYICDMPYPITGFHTKDVHAKKDVHCRTSKSISSILDHLKCDKFRLNGPQFNVRDKQPQNIDFRVIDTALKRYFISLLS